MGPSGRVSDLRREKGMKTTRPETSALLWQPPGFLLQKFTSLYIFPSVSGKHFNNSTITNPCDMRL
jgi:hypothetical protein